MGEPVIERMRRIGRDIYLTGLVSTRAGNMSVRIRDTIVMSRVGASLGRLAPEDFVEIPVAGPGDRDADVSSDLVIHRAIYEQTENRAVLHAHGPETIIASMAGGPISPADHEGRLLIPLVPVAEEAEVRSELAATIGRDVAAGSRIVAVRGHGTFAAGDAIEAAAHWTTCLEQSCRILRAL
jgi:L-fuculose-phosphate aldolase